MEIGKTLYITDRMEWREWLQNNFDTEEEIWLIFPNKASGKPRLMYNDAVEEALCFGWIDSIIKKYDKMSSAQRFSPRNPKSGYSQPNKERLRWLLNNNRLHPTVQKMAERMLQEKFEFPEDIISVLKEDPEVWLNYQNFSSAYQRIRIAYIDSARNRPEEFEKRLQNFIEKTRQNTLIGFGGIKKYY
jgi:uncharacterized protein YdeI (YjbR/CyaY-like superfamily)